MTDKKCKFPECTNKVKAAGLCNTHYKQKLKYGKPGSTLTHNKGKMCKVDGCKKDAVSKGMCRNHYIQNLKYGDPTVLIKGHNSGLCSVCNEKPAKKLGMCQNCYYRKRIKTDPKFAEKMASRNGRRRAAKNGGESEKYTKSDVIENCGNKCHLCGKEIDLTRKYPDPQSFSIDHVIPVSRGGNDVLGNVKPAHFGCNAGKRDRIR